MPVEPAAAGTAPAAAGEENFLERGPTLTKRISLDDTMLQVVEPVRAIPRFGIYGWAATAFS